MPCWGCPTTGKAELNLEWCTMPVVQEAVRKTGSSPGECPGKTHHLRVHCTKLCYFINEKFHEKF